VTPGSGQAWRHYTTAAEFVAAVKRDRREEWAANLARLAEEEQAKR
jgi:hypothetical protein